MGITDDHIKDLVEIAAKSLEGEDGKLFVEWGSAFAAGRLAAKVPHGLHDWIREEVVVFRIFRAVLRDSRLPLEINWEWPYPEDSARAGGKMDLALFDRSSNRTSVPDVCIEAKWWGNNEELRKDIKKMQEGMPKHVRKFLLLFGRAAEETFESVESWVRDLRVGLKRDWHRTFRLRREKHLEDKQAWPFFYVVMAEVVA